MRLRAPRPLRRRHPRNLVLGRRPRPPVHVLLHAPRLHRGIRPQPADAARRANCSCSCSAGDAGDRELDASGGWHPAARRLQHCLHRYYCHDRCYSYVRQRRYGDGHHGPASIAPDRVHPSFCGSSLGREWGDHFDDVDVEFGRNFQHGRGDSGPEFGLCDYDVVVGRDLQLARIQRRVGRI